jgi:hypothetical protein
MRRMNENEKEEEEEEEGKGKRKKEIKNSFFVEKNYKRVLLVPIVLWSNYFYKKSISFSLSIFSRH